MSINSEGSRQKPISVSSTLNIEKEIKMETVIFLRAIFWIGFIAAFVGITVSIELGNRLVSRLKSRKDKTEPVQLSLFTNSELSSTG